MAVWVWIGRNRRPFNPDQSGCGCLVPQFRTFSPLVLNRVAFPTSRVIHNFGSPPAPRSWDFFTGTKLWPFHRYILCASCASSLIKRFFQLSFTPWSPHNWTISVNSTWGLRTLHYTWTLQLVQSSLSSTGHSLLCPSVSICYTNSIGYQLASDAVPRHCLLPLKLIMA